MGTTYSGISSSVRALGQALSPKWKAASISCPANSKRLELGDDLDQDFRVLGRELCQARNQPAGAKRGQAGNGQLAPLAAISQQFQRCGLDVLKFRANLVCVDGFPLRLAQGRSPCVRTGAGQADLP